MKLTYGELISNINAIGGLIEREKNRVGKEALKGNLALCVSRNNRLMIQEYQNHYMQELEQLKEKYKDETELNEKVKELLDFEVEIPLRTVTENVVQATNLTLEDIDALLFMITE